MAGPQPKRSVLRGLSRLARLRADGLEEFGDRPRDFLNSLAPFCGFALVGALLRAGAGYRIEALTEATMTLVALLGPPVIAHALARRWGREAEWLRYATAFTWCHWVIVMAFAVMLAAVTGLLAGLGARPEIAVAAAELIWAAYGLSLHWLLARRALGVSRGRAALLVAAVELGTFALLIGPLLAGGRVLPATGPA